MHVTVQPERGVYLEDFIDGRIQGMWMWKHDDGTERLGHKYGGRMACATSVVAARDTATMAQETAEAMQVTLAANAAAARDERWQVCERDKFMPGMRAVAAMDATHVSGCCSHVALRIVHEQRPYHFHAGPKPMCN